jgi:transcriptional regulator with XRE-family HTH domain
MGHFAVNLASTIRSRRLAFDLTVEDAARLARVTPERLQSIESGERPSTRELASIAEALACDPANLAKGALDDPRRSPARFKTGEGASRLAGGDLRLLARAAEAGRILASLKGLLQESSSKLPVHRHVVAPSPAVESWRDGYELGVQARRALSPERGPISSVQGLLEEMGVHVAFVDFAAGVEAASIFEVGACPVILVNRRAPKCDYPLARRALLAHELCHLLHDGGERDLTVVTREMDPSAIEQRANGFAPSFLAPGDWVRDQRPTGVDARQVVVWLAQSWGLSFEGAAWHAKNLKLLDAVEAERLALGRKSRVDSRFEMELPRTPPEQFGIEVEPTALTAGLLAETAIVASAEDVISRARAAEILSLQ